MKPIPALLVVNPVFVSPIETTIRTIRTRFAQIQWTSRHRSEPEVSKR